MPLISVCRLTAFHQSRLSTIPDYILRPLQSPFISQGQYPISIKFSHPYHQLYQYVQLRHPPHCRPGPPHILPAGLHYTDQPDTPSGPISRECASNPSLGPPALNTQWLLPWTKASTSPTTPSVSAILTPLAALAISSEWMPR